MMNHTYSQILLKKALALALALAFMLTLSITACGSSGGDPSGGYGGGLPDGTYKPVAVTIPVVGRIEMSGTDAMAAAYMDYSVVISGDTFTAKMDGVSSGVKYSYKDDTLTFADAPSTGFDMEYKDDALLWSLGGGIVIEMKK